MISGMKKVIALGVAIVCALTLSCFALVPNAQANTGHWFFSFSKSDGVHKCGPVIKSDTNKYLRLSIKKSADNVFTPNKSVIGFRGRRANNDPATRYKTFTNYTDSGSIKYRTNMHKKGYKYYLCGQVDSSSQKNLIQVWGYWTP